MKIKQIAVFFAIFTIAVLITAGCASSASGKKSGATVFITVGDTKNLASLLPETFTGSIAWKSDAPEIASVSQDGTVTAITVTDNLTARAAQVIATGTANITAAAGSQSRVITVITTVEGQVDLLELPPLKDQFKNYFLLGNIFNPQNVSSNGAIIPRITRHYNALTVENNMKPQYIAPTRSGNNITYNFRDADRMVDAANALGIKVIGHTLLWHSQIPQWQKDLASADRNTALTLMKKYISEYAGHFAGKIYSWDVVNETFPDSGVNASADWRAVMRPENPWYKSIGADYIYEGFLAVRQADPNAILYYNDYNLDQPGKATMVRNMVRDVNEQYAKAFPRETRKLIEGIGLQSHHNTQIATANIKVTLDLFRPLGVKLSITELDLLAQSWGMYSPIGGGTNKEDMSTVTNQGLLTQAKLYGEYMRLFIANSDIIERVSLWGILDNQSWRSGARPLLFDTDGMAKPAYYGFIGALPK